MHQVPADIAYDIAAAVLDKPYRPLALDTATDPEALAGLPAKFRFPHDFYQPDAVVQLSATLGEVQLHWPSGESSVVNSDRQEPVHRPQLLGGGGNRAGCRGARDSLEI